MFEWLREQITNAWLKGLHIKEGIFGKNSVTIGNLITMDDQTPTASGQIGMDMSSGRLQGFTAEQARLLAYEDELVPSGLRNKIILYVQPENWIKYGAGTDTIMYISEDDKQVRALTGTDPDQTGTFRKRVQIPGDFIYFKENGVRLKTRKDGDVDFISLSLSKDGTEDPGVNDVEVLPSGQGFFQQFEFTPSGTYVPHEFITLIIAIKVDASERGDFVDFEVRYNA